MAKLLKPLVVIVLLVSIAALIIQAFVLFPKRELIKQRTQKLEGGVERLVGTLKGSLSEEIRAQVPFTASALKIGHPDEFPRLDQELDRAVRVANAVLQGWNDTKVDLENTRQDLENTRAELENTKNQLEDARTQIVQLNETIRAKNEELDEKNRRIAGLEEEKTSLESQVASLNDTIAQQQDQIAQLEEEKGMLEVQLEKLTREVYKEITMKPGTSGKIVYANDKWNFVVIDIGSVDGAQPTAELIVHREDKMIGKIKLSAVRDHVSIAEVIPSFQKGAIKEGDNVLF